MDAVDPFVVAEGVFDGGEYETVEYPDDSILLRVVQGSVQVVEFSSEDRDGPPVHLHPWHEIEYVIDGDVEFYVRDRWIAAGPGSVQMLPAGVGHSLRVPAGSARLLMVTIGAPYDQFARDLAEMYASGSADLETVAEIAGRHGVRLADGDS